MYIPCDRWHSEPAEHSLDSLFKRRFTVKKIVALTYNDVEGRSLCISTVSLCANTYS